jgi:hypothetical protein
MMALYISMHSSDAAMRNSIALNNRSIAYNLHYFFAKPTPQI